MPETRSGCCRASYGTASVSLAPTRQGDNNFIPAAVLISHIGLQDTEFPHHDRDVMTQPAGITGAIRPAGRFAHIAFLYCTTLGTYLLSALCFAWYAQTDEIALLLLGWVAFGTASDFLSHILGLHFGRHRRFLLWYARINFSALCFGIPFTTMAGAFVIAAIDPGGISARIVPYHVEILIASLLFGALFMFARFRYIEIAGGVELTLDKTDPYTSRIFAARRGFLGLSLLLGITVMADGIGTPWAIWAALFGGSFIATVPLHIMHKHYASMFFEAFTLAVLGYGSWLVFVA